MQAPFLAASSAEMLLTKARSHATCLALATACTPATIRSTSALSVCKAVQKWGRRMYEENLTKVKKLYCRQYLVTLSPHAEL